jgi:hypothetical protein
MNRHVTTEQNCSLDGKTSHVLRQSIKANTHIARSGLKKCAHGTYLQIGTFPVGAPRFHLKSRIPRSEYTMNIFYIIGVIVVVLFVAGFFGLHA